MRVLSMHTYELSETRTKNKQKHGRYLYHDAELGKEEVDEKDSEKTLKQWPHCEEVSYGAIHKG
nr:hypothetical protein Iba_chr11dCG9280 [Ipomoea batatas]GMD69540.1 hypothetical protein Iba_chr12dCG19980 [Ipomoea batatas]GME14633.1 hypothetical protein Iba_scaffold15322CG0010 [Ipomoea batatas]GME20189.1 hypothetical protein Iba_scaffold24460CG0010 [Ipomoea batatas]